MQSIQRRVGRLGILPRTPNEADIEAMLRDFNDSKKMLEDIEKAAKQWRDAWTNILTHQLISAELFHALYKPLGAKGGEYSAHVAVETPPATLERAAQLQSAFSELKNDMLEEIADIERKLVIPAKIGRDSLKPMEKAIKKREDKKVDYEKFKSRAEALQRKKTRSDRENTALYKHESDLERATHEYEYADEGLRTQLPRLNAATFSLLPHLLAIQIIIQNNLIGNLYTVLHQYSHENGYPDPPPELDEVVPVWDSTFTPLRQEIETGFVFLKKGKAVQQPMRLGDEKSYTGINLRSKVGMSNREKSNDSAPTVRPSRSPRPSYSVDPPSDDGPPPYLANRPSFNSLNTAKPSPALSPSPGVDPWGRRTSTVSNVSTSTNGTNSHHDDYFGRPRIPSSTSSTSLGLSNPAAGKKKPPPPPPKKVGSFHGEFVTAMYDFDGQGEGDLAFREGDRIRVVKKTDSSQDWWEGELRGVKGSFPANYCK